MQKYHVHNHIPITTQLYLIGLNIELKHHKKGGKKKRREAASLRGKTGLNLISHFLLCHFKITVGYGEKYITFPSSFALP